MNTKDKYLILTGVIVAMVIAVISPFIASSNPDGLEKSAQNLGVHDSEPAIKPLFPNYTVKAFGDSPLSGIAALAIGILIALGLGYIVAKILKRKKPPEESQ